MQLLKTLTIGAALGGAIAGSAQALDVNADITTDTTWTAADSPVFLKAPILVKNAATLTIDPGVIVITLEQDDGGLVVIRDSQIFVNGTADAPVIMTSGNDVGTWAGSVVETISGDGIPDPGPNGKWEPNINPQVVTDDDDVTNVITVGDPTTGTWRAATREWRNLTILGRGVISASEFDFDGNGTPDPRLNDQGNPNPDVPDGTATAQMEGLDLGDGTIEEISYGGADDNDDSGSISYLSTRYTGRVLGVGDELNAISLGALGRETDINHLDLMNNVDDGVEIWGGTLNLKYVNIWNVGDDSFDFDQGWRGKAQFGLIVQGFANPEASQGSGVGDNIFEHDGAEQSDAQPRTTVTLYNFTAVGEPNRGDGATTWRDNARVQYRNMLFMDVGEELVRFDGDDGDGGEGYGFNGTHSFASTWTTPAGTLPTINASAVSPFTPAELYTVQIDGFLSEITDSVVFNLSSDPDDVAYPVPGKNGVALSVLNGSQGSPESRAETHNFVVATLPIAALTRGPIDINALMEPVATIDPRPVAAEAKTSVGAAPADGFFTPAEYRGGFSPTKNWAEGWTAADAFGFFVNTGTNPADPAETIALSAKISFPTVDGAVYTVLESTDGVNFSPFATVVGDGGTVSVADLDDFDPAKFYKVEAQ